MSVRHVYQFDEQGADIYLQGRLQLHGSASQRQFKPSICISLELAKNFVSYLIAVGQLQGNATSIRVKLVDRIVLKTLF